MTTCAGTNTIAALLAGAVDAAAAERLELHLDGCGACRRLVAELGRGLSAVGGAPVKCERLPQVGETIGRYEIARVVGVGGMGVVYEAHDTTLDRRVAVKLLRPDLLEGASLLAEAQAMARLQHPNIVTVFDTGIANGQLYVCMEYVAGSTLRAWVDGRARTWRDIMAVYASAAEGLAYVHRAGLVHLDFKPDNVLVDRDGRVRVTDFGLARIVDARPAHGPRLLVGTPAYMAPEQRRCEPTDARADQYAFCTSLREALGDRSAPGWLQRVIARGLAVDREDRFATMDDLLAALTSRLTQRRRRAGSALVVAAFGAAAFAVSMPRTANPQIIERPTTLVVDRPVLHVTSAQQAPRSERTAERSAAASVDRRTETQARAGTPAYVPSFRRPVAPPMLDPGISFLAAIHADAQRPILEADADELGSAGFTTELGICDDGSLRTCSLAVPVCPNETVLAVHGGCWTCADAQTCMPLGLPRTCNDGTQLRCTSTRPACEGRLVAAIRNGCWSCEDPFTCVTRSTPTKPLPRPPVCGNHKCERGESDRCAIDCGGSGSGSGSGGGSNTGSGGGATCGNGFCEIGEEHATCASDCCETDATGACAAVCGNGFCEASEDHAGCASDCCETTSTGACVPVCGNGFCETGESASCADCS